MLAKPEPKFHSGKQRPGSIDLDQARVFLEALDPAATAFTFQTFDDTKNRKDGRLARVIHASLDEAAAELMRLNALGTGVFVTVNATDGKGRKVDNIIRRRAVWQDDDKGFKGKFPLEPSLVVKTSPGKFQRYWLTDGLTMKEFKAVMQCVVCHYGCDPGAKDMARVLRLPGFYHRKNKPHLVRVIEASGRRYSREQILAAFPPVERKKASHNPNGAAGTSFHARDDEIERIRHALSYIPPDGREIWGEIGMALKAHLGESGRPFWDEWSASSAKFDERDSDKVWRSFRRDGIGIGTLFHHARQHGWPDSVRRCSLGNKNNGAEAKGTAAPQSWPEPDMTIVNQTRLAPPELGLQPFGELAAWIRQMAEQKGAPVDFVALALLVIVSSLIGVKRLASPWEGWREPAMLWGALVAPPSQNKSPAIDPFLAALRTIEKRKCDTFEEAEREWQAKKLEADAVRKLWERTAKKAIEAGETVPPLPPNADVPEAPVKPRLWVSDVTAEKAARLMAAHPGGLLCYRDELSGWLGGFGRYSGSPADRAFWLETYGGRSFRVDRVSGGEIDVPFCAAAILGGIQPDRLSRQVFSGDDDGLAARFIYAWPNPVVPRRPAQCADEEAIVAPLERLANLGLASGTYGPKPRCLPLDKFAMDAFQTWREQHHSEAMEATGMYAGALGKLPGTTLRLALNLRYLHWAMNRENDEPPLISERMLGFALILIDGWIIPHLRRVFGEASVPKADQGAQVLARWILAKRPDRFNASTLRRSPEIPGLRDGTDMDAACAELAEANWLRREGGRHGDRPGRQRKDFWVNPNVYARCG